MGVPRPAQCVGLLATLPPPPSHTHLWVLSGGVCTRGWARGGVGGVGGCPHGHSACGDNGDISVVGDREVTAGAEQCAGAGALPALAHPAPLSAPLPLVHTRVCPGTATHCTLFALSCLSFPPPVLSPWGDPGPGAPPGPHSVPPPRTPSPISAPHSQDTPTAPFGLHGPILGSPHGCHSPGAPHPIPQTPHGRHPCGTPSLHPPPILRTSLHPSFWWGGGAPSGLPSPPTPSPGPLVAPPPPQPS